MNKTKRIYFITNYIKALLCFFGIGGSFYTMMHLEAKPELLIPAGILLLVFWAVFWEMEGKRERLILGGVLAVVVLILAVWGHSWIREGLNAAANQLLDLAGTRFGRYYAHYTVSLQGEQSAYALTLILFLAAVLFSGFVTYWIRNEVRGLMFVLGLVLCVAGIVLQSMPHPICFALLLFALGILVVRGGDGNASLSVLALTGVMGLVLFGILFLLVPQDTYSKWQPITALQEQITKEVQQQRYGRSTVSALPQGDFTQIHALSAEAAPALEVTMNQPESLYLRGYVGESYTPSGWEPLDAAQKYSSAEIFYWLHQGGFFGENQLATLAILVNPEETTDQVQISIRNTGADSRYLYTPYEWSADPQELLDTKGIGDDRAKAEGLFGNRQYAFVSLTNQVKNYPKLSTLLYEQEDQPSDALEEYIQQESYYNVYVYDSYTDISDDEKTLLGKELGSYTTEDGGHLDYQEAKQKILDYLSANITYEEAPKKSSDPDFLTGFLKDAREGYSVHYATAAAMMFRYYGIPARYVEGYLVTPEDAKQAGADTPLHIDTTHAHAWAEYYQDGIGWIPFECVPKYLAVMEQPDYMEGTYSESGSGYGTGDGNKQEPDNYEDNEHHFKRQEQKQIPVWTLWIILGAVLCVLVCLLLWRYLKKRKAWKARQAGMQGPDYGRAITWIYAYMEDLAQVSGKEISTGEVYPIYEEARFSNHKIEKDNWQKLWQWKEEGTSRIRSQLKWHEKLKLKYGKFLL